jgi:hypothetical protein
VQKNATAARMRTPSHGPTPGLCVSGNVRADLMVGRRLVDLIRTRHIGALLRLTGKSRPTLYRRLAEHAKAGGGVQVSYGRWHAVTTEEPPR